MSKNKIIISGCQAGIGNRLKNMMSIQRMINRGVYENWRIMWPMGWNMISQFTDLFDLSEDLVIDLETEGASILNKPKEMDITHSDRFWLAPTDNIPKGFATYKYDPWRDKDVADWHFGRNIDFEYERTPINITDEYVLALKSLPFKKEFIEEANEFADKYFDENTVSVNIRTWPECPKRSPLFDIDVYFEIMDNMPDKNFFVTSDLYATISIVKDRYKGRVICYNPLGVTDSTRQWGVKDNIMDLLLSAKNKTLIVAWLSSFSEIAWYLSGCRSRVIIPIRGQGDEFSR